MDFLQDVKDADHPDRDAQFRYINTRVKQAMKSGWPVISVDTRVFTLGDDLGAELLRRHPAA